MKEFSSCIRPPLLSAASGSPGSSGSSFVGPTLGSAALT